MKIISRKDAKEQGLKRYFTGKPCKHGHISERQTTNGGCLICSKDNMNRYYKEDPEKFRVASRVYHSNNRDKSIESSRKWKSNNRQHCVDYAIQYSKNNPDVKKRTIAKLNADPVRRAAKLLRQSTKRKENNARYSAYQTKRNAAKIERTPLWYVHEDIIPFFIERDALIKKTGVNQEVDHEIPMQGELVSGLHIASNLRIMIASENRSKNNKWNPMNEIEMVYWDDGTYTQEIKYKK